MFPEPRANEVRVKVLAAGVSFADIFMRQGVHPESWNVGRTPFTPGWDVVGVVDKLGDKVSTWQTGQIVGAYEEYIILSSNDLVPVPLQRTLTTLAQSAELTDKGFAGYSSQRSLIFCLIKAAACSAV
jgi:NADPH:quinone reductase-like Zn-dependent oxidoreductase